MASVGSAPAGGPTGTAALRATGCEPAGVTQTVIARYERGDRRPSAARLQMNAAVLGLDQHELLVLAGYHTNGAG